MTLGKSLRLRRIFANGRALIVDCAPLAGDRIGKVGLLARAGADAVILTPGLLDAVSEELAALSAILRIDGGFGRRQQLLSVQAALEMGAEAVLVSVEASFPVPGEELERFGRVSEDARRLGMPVIAEIAGEEWMDVSRIVADYGADVILVRTMGPASSDRQFIRKTGRPFLASLGEDPGGASELLGVVYDLMQGAAQGVVLRDRGLLESQMLRAIHGLVHQGISADEALDIANAV